MKVFDIFSGCGGASLGFQKAGFTIVGGIDIDADACNTFKKNLSVEPIVGDVTKINWKKILSNLGLERGELDVIIGCPPCQGFTRLRCSVPNDPRNELVFYYSKIVKYFLPKFVVFENVPGILNSKHRKYFNSFLKKIENLGYKYIYGTLNAADFGVPQIRKRVIVIATRLRNIRLSLPRPTVKKYKTVREAFEGLPPVRAGEVCKWIPNHAAPKHTDRIMKIIKMIPKDGGSIRNLPKKYWLKCHLNHKGHRDVYGRLWWDRPAPTVTSGCLSASKGRYIHPSQDRTITAREAARLQGFSDNFVFYGTLTSVARQIGNSLPPPLAEAVANHIFTLIS